MSESGPEVRERIELLIEARDVGGDDVAEALTAGYGYALTLESQRVRTERRITELAAEAMDPEAASELRRLWLRHRTLESELGELRTQLHRLERAQPAAR
jgi:hypothetical protein